MGEKEVKLSVSMTGEDFLKYEKWRKQPAIKLSAKQRISVLFFAFYFLSVLAVFAGLHHIIHYVLFPPAPAPPTPLISLWGVPFMYYVPSLFVFLVGVGFAFHGFAIIRR